MIIDFQYDAVLGLRSWVIEPSPVKHTKSKKRKRSNKEFQHSNAVFNSYKKRR